MNIIQQLEAEAIEQFKSGKNIPEFRPGDTLRVGVKVVEGERTRIQNFEDVCIARANRGLGSSFTVRKISFGAAVERAELQYRIALRTLESAGRDETAAEVRLFREALQDAISRLDEHRPPTSESDDSYAGTMLQIDMAIVGALIVIDIGSREAARAVLTPIGERLESWRQR